MWKPFGLANLDDLEQLDGVPPTEVLKASDRDLGAPGHEHQERGTLLEVHLLDDFPVPFDLVILDSVALVVRVGLEVFN